MNSKSFLFGLLFFIIICVNAGFFLYANTRPIQWQQSEMAMESYYWSVDLYGPDKNTLHSELRLEDFQKLFYPKKGLGSYRARPLSYLFELLSSKLHCWMEQVTFRNYALIFLHLINAFLVYFLLVGLFQNRVYAVGWSMLFCNSGIALSTLFFPFRNARLLCLFFFLLSWICLLKKDAAFSKLPKIRISFFCFFTIFCFFSDEFAFVLYPFLFLFYFIRDGRTMFSNRWTNRTIFVSIFLYLLLLLGNYQIARMIDPVKHMGEYQFFLQYFSVERLGQISFYANLFESYSLYFMRFLLGYWDHSVSGNMALGATILLGLMFFVRSKEKKDVRIAFLCFVWVLLIGICVPHYYGIHPWIMPDHAQYPSLLYFSYYYTYIPAFLFVLGSAFLLKKGFFSDRRLKLFFLIALTAINYSNMRHLYQGVEATRKFHDNAFHPYVVVENILDFQKKMSLFKQGSVYLSFPSGSKQRFSPSASTLSEVDSHVMKTPLLKSYLPYALTVPVQFLREIEKGEIVISLDNVSVVRPSSRGEELRNVRYFYDLHQRKGIDLQSLKTRRGDPAWKPNPVEEKGYKGQFVWAQPEKSTSLVFFVKGGSYVGLEINGKSQKLIQVYGQSYQMFSTPIESSQEPLDVKIQIDPMLHKYPVYLLGPFLINRDRQLINNP